ncbi:MAG: T9SS type A sorting domain-containing protein [Candidatus Eiseniibacteriota bacterium]
MDPGTTNRREFLKVSGAVALGLVGAAAVSLPIRRAHLAPPLWSAIPDQAWAIGVPVYLDLSNYCSDPDGDALTFGLNRPLPAGVNLVGSVISGTPTASFSASSFIATADDEGAPPATPGPRLVASPNPSPGAVRFLGESRQTLPATGALRVFAVAGRRVFEKEFPVTGSPYEVDWDGRASDGSRVPSGIYMATVVIGSESAKTRLVLAE